MALQKIVSGGQTGVDRAALDAAHQLKLPAGGWCPKGRRAEDGPIPRSYPLTETPSSAYEQRTEWNVRDSDGTLILTRGAPEGGTALTIEYARRHKKPFLIIDFEAKAEIPKLISWMEKNAINVLNVAGPRLSKQPHIYHDTLRFLLNHLQK